MALVVEEFRKFVVNHESHSERQLLLLILHQQEQQMADFTALDAAIAQLQSDVAALIAAQVPPTNDQPAVDSAAASVAAIDASVQAALPAPAPAPTE